jgi:hypothetical protein
VTELIYRLFADSSGFYVPGKDEGEPHCRLDIQNTKVFVLVGQYGDSDLSECSEPCMVRVTSQTQ